MDTSVIDPFQDDYDTVLIGEDGNADFPCDVNSSFQNFSNDVSQQYSAPVISQAQLTEAQIGIIKNIVRKKLRLNSEDEILLAPRGEIQRAANLTENQLVDFLYSISFPFCQSVTAASALELYNDDSNHNKLSLGCPYLDKFLNGGLLCSGITEIVGESGAGKTQICLQLALNTMLPVEQGGLQGKVLYVCTEGRFPLKRLEQMSSGLIQKYPELSADDITNNIFVHDVSTDTQLLDLLNEDVPKLLKDESVKLIVIDSIAALFRFEYSSTTEDMSARSSMLLKIASRLKLLSDSFNCCIVAINQVSDIFNNSQKFHLLPASSKVAPALGLTWSNCVNTRIMLERTRRMYNYTSKSFSATIDENTNDNNNEPASKKQKKDESADVVVRKMHILLASHLMNESCSFVVHRDGVSGIREEM